MSAMWPRRHRNALGRDADRATQTRRRLRRACRDRCHLESARRGVWMSVPPLVRALNAGPGSPVPRENGWRGNEVGTRRWAGLTVKVAALGSSHGEVPAEDVVLQLARASVGRCAEEREFGGETDLEWSRSVVGAVVAFELLRLLQQATDPCRAHCRTALGCRHCCWRAVESSVAST